MVDFTGIDFITGCLAGVANVAMLLLWKARLRCKGCDDKARIMGAQAGKIELYREIIGNKDEQIKHLENVNERLLLKIGIYRVDSGAKESPADPLKEADKKQVDRAVASGGEAFGADD